MTDLGNMIYPLILGGIAFLFLLISLPLRKSEYMWQWLTVIAWSLGLASVLLTAILALTGNIA